MPRHHKNRRHQASAFDNQITEQEYVIDFGQDEPRAFTDFERDVGESMALSMGAVTDGAGYFERNVSLSPYAGLLNHFHKQGRPGFSEQAFKLAGSHVAKNARNGKLKLSMDPVVVDQYLHGTNESVNYLGVVKDFAVKGLPKPYIEWDLRKGKSNYIFSVNGVAYKDYVAGRVDDRELRQAIRRSRNANKARMTLKAPDPNSARSRKVVAYKESNNAKRAARRAAESSAAGGVLGRDLDVRRSQLNGANGEVTGSDDVAYRILGVSGSLEFEAVDLLTAFELYCVVSDFFGFDVDLYSDRGDPEPVVPSHDDYFVDSFVLVTLWYTTVALEDDVIEVPCLGGRYQVSLRVIRKLALTLPLNGNNGSYTNTDDHNFICYAQEIEGTYYYVYNNKVCTLGYEPLAPIITEDGDEIQFVFREMTIVGAHKHHTGCLKFEDDQQSCTIKNPFFHLHLQAVSREFPNAHYWVVRDLHAAEVKHWVGGKRGESRHTAIQHRLSNSGYFDLLDGNNMLFTQIRAILHHTLIYSSEVQARKLTTTAVTPLYNPDNPFRGVKPSGSFMLWKGVKTRGKSYEVRRDWFKVSGKGFHWVNGMPRFKVDGVGAERRKTVFFRIRPFNEFVYPEYSAENVSFALSRILKSRSSGLADESPEDRQDYERFLITNQAWVCQDQMLPSFKEITNMKPDLSGFRRNGVDYDFESPLASATFFNLLQGTGGPADDIFEGDLPEPGMEGLLENESYADSEDSQGNLAHVGVAHDDREDIMRKARKQLNGYMDTVNKSWWRRFQEALGSLARGLLDVWDQLFTQGSRARQDLNFVEEFMGGIFPPGELVNPRTIVNNASNIGHLCEQSVMSTTREISRIYASLASPLKTLRELMWSALFDTPARRLRHAQAALVSCPEAGFKDEDCKFGKDGRLFVNYNSLVVASGFDSMWLKYQVCRAFSARDLDPDASTDTVVINLMNVSIVNVSYCANYVELFCMRAPRDGKMRSICLVFSDDSALFFVKDGRLSMGESDIESNDTGVTTLFACVHKIKAQRSLEIADMAIRAMVEPMIIKHPAQKNAVCRDHYIKLTPTALFMGSGLPDTTGANNIGNTNCTMLGARLVCQHPEGMGGFDACMAAAAEAFGQRVQTVVHTSLPRMTFLKRSFMKADHGLVCPLVWGALLKSFGVVYGPLEAHHLGVDRAEFVLLSDTEKMEWFFSAVVAGYVCEPHSSVLDAMRDRFNHKRGVANPIYKHADMNTSRSFSSFCICDSEWCVRYDCAPSEIAELCSLIRNLTLGDQIYLPLLDRIMHIDYGVDLPP